MAEPLPIWVTLDGHEPAPALEAFLREAVPFGVLLFARHLKSPEQVRALTAAVREGAPGVRVALDQEGGRVNRLKVLGMEFPGADEAVGAPGRVESNARAMGDALRDLGFDVDFAPVADLGPAGNGTGLETRCYGDDPRTVTACCRAFLRGLSAAGVSGCLKHFPGLGGSAVDSHRDLPEVPGALADRQWHLRPYRELAGEVPFVMTAHGRYAHLEDDAPSSLSPATYALLREIGFQGLAVTDDLNMGAVRGDGPLWARALRALAAGADLALWVGREEETLEACARLRAAACRLSAGPSQPMLGSGEAP